MALPARALLGSNALDAASRQLLTVTFNILAVTTLGFSVTQLGVLNALGSIWFLLLAVPAGAMVDRLGAVRVLTWSYVVKSAAAAAVVLLYATGSLGFVTAMVLEASLGILTIVAENAQSAATPEFADDDAAVTRVAARLASADEVAGIAMPSVAGFAVAHWGGTPALSVCVVLAVAAVAAFFPAFRRCPVSNVENVSPGSMSPSTGFFAGFHALKADHFLAVTVFVIALGNMGLAMGDTVLSVLILRELDLGASFYGVLGTVAALAGLVASMLAPRVVDRVSPPRIFAVGSFLQALIAALPLVALNWHVASRPLLLGFEVAWSATLVVTNIAGYAYLTRSVEREVLGRTSAARRMLTMGCVPFAALAGGLLADAGGLWLPLLVWPALSALGALVFVLWSRRSDNGNAPGK